MKYRRFKLNLTLPLAMLAALLCGATGGAKRAATPSDEDRARAAYIFLEASNNLFNGNPGSAYMMLHRAAELDPTDIAINGALAELVLGYGLGDSAETEKAYRALRDRFVLNPQDKTSGEIFINVARHLDRTNDVRETYRLLAETHPNNPDYALEYAYQRALQWNKGDTAAISEAIKVFDNLESRIGYDRTLMAHRVRTLAISRDSAAILHEIQRYGAIAPADPEANIAAGSMLMMAGMPDSAIFYLNRACELDSTLGEAFLARANYYSALGDSAEYDAQVMHALESPSLEPDTKLELLTNYTRQFYTDESRHDQLNNLFIKMIDMHPGEAGLHNLYGAFLAMGDSVALAAEQFGYAMDLEPDNEDYAHYCLQIAVETDDTIKAVDIARTASRRFNNPYFPVVGASTLLMMKRYDEALAMLDSFNIAAVENPAGISAFYQSRGDILYAMNERDSAYVVYDKALSYNPGNSMVLNNVAYYLAVDGIDLDRAEEYIRRAITDNPLSPTYLDTYAWVLFKKKDYKGAKVQIDVALDQLLPSVEAVDTIAADSVVSIEDINMDEQAAMVEIEEVAGETLEPGSAEIYDHAGDIYFMNGEPEQALEFWQKAAALDPENEKIKKKIKNKAYFFE